VEVSVYEPNAEAPPPGRWKETVIYPVCQLHAQQAMGREAIEWKQ
jgi:hypothetical protein